MSFKTALFSLADLRKLFDLATQVRFLESSALSANSSAVLMLCATMPRAHTTVHVNLDTMGTDGLAKVVK